MRIIKHGDLERKAERKRFTCRDCGCVFDAESGEYKIGTHYNETYFSCRCPCCNGFCSIER